MKLVIGIVRPEQKMGLSKKVRFEVAVSDAFAQPAVDALCEDGRTGEVGDGATAPLRASGPAVDAA